jgi:hypothetical protein
VILVRDNGGAGTLTINGPGAGLNGTLAATGVGGAINIAPAGALTFQGGGTITLNSIAATGSAGTPIDTTVAAGTTVSANTLVMNIDGTAAGAIRNFGTISTTAGSLRVVAPTGNLTITGTGNYSSPSAATSPVQFQASSNATSQIIIPAGVTPNISSAAGASVQFLTPNLNIGSTTAMTSTNAVNFGFHDNLSGPAGTLTISGPGGGSTVNFSGPAGTTFTFQPGTMTPTGVFTATANRALSFTGTNTFDFGGNLTLRTTGSGATTIGAGTTVRGANVTESGNLTVNGSLLSLGAITASTSSVTLGNGALIEGTSNVLINGQLPAGTAMTITAPVGGSATIRSTTGQVNFDNGASFGNNALTFAGGGTLNLQGTQIRTTSGTNTTISGVSIVTNNNTFMTVNGTLQNDGSLVAGGNLNATFTGNSLVRGTGSFSSNLNNATITFSAPTFNLDIGGTGTIGATGGATGVNVVATAANLTMSSTRSIDTNAAGGQVTLTGTSSVTIGDGTASRTLTVANGTLLVTTPQLNLGASGNSGSITVNSSATGVTPALKIDAPGNLSIRSCVGCTGAGNTSTLTTANGDISITPTGSLAFDIQPGAGTTTIAVSGGNLITSTTNNTTSVAANTRLQSNRNINMTVNSQTLSIAGTGSIVTTGPGAVNLTVSGSNAATAIVNAGLIDSSANPTITVAGGAGNGVLTNNGTIQSSGNRIDILTPTEMTVAGTGTMRLVNPAVGNTINVSTTGFGATRVTIAGTNTYDSGNGTVSWQATNGTNTAVLQVGGGVKTIQSGQTLSIVAPVVGFAGGSGVAAGGAGNITIAMNAPAGSTTFDLDAPGGGQTATLNAGTGGNITVDLATGTALRMNNAGTISVTGGNLTTVTRNAGTIINGGILQNTAGSINMSVLGTTSAASFTNSGTVRTTASGTTLNITVNNSTAGVANLNNNASGTLSAQTTMNISLTNAGLNNAGTITALSSAAGNALTVNMNGNTLTNSGTMSTPNADMLLASSAGLTIAGAGSLAVRATGTIAMNGTSVTLADTTAQTISTGQTLNFNTSDLRFGTNNGVPANVSITGTNTAINFNPVGNGTITVAEAKNATINTGGGALSLRPTGNLTLTKTGTNPSTLNLNSGAGTLLVQAGGVAQTLRIDAGLTVNTSSTNAAGVRFLANNGTVLNNGTIQDNSPVRCS